ncbi:pentatricopeptide repeat-containing protein At5g55740, chloroplastic [Arachis stenosperma]|uniref:pentatricopeptide repeat-containing protein At5g55740, chloroplastic n=1 Tax=Arachis stenosperma TaxID=217475 RepID=UPI0025ABF7C4|nr:pentatricopeptide repeat-containing protein At5g55740, chloroplastic [Arachis stenosperma]XP_057741075.1 pentatricopeptide repeat-containing protein At5g55740, chloroplastic [Arachis stenosperma]XP_057741083.1 pentatricopeptide repeat-containing protein At5g55740, chloroplastic [Arachis stenosperma]XP_057741092.1 pentatricopeptide repeat-containing protein At5g55740, chloroplastic [Arachis stenosperma]XP_057741100.1 pentatricopeptide repeat-containing protein At5g55740, chloroplastic [Arachi
MAATLLTPNTALQLPHSKPQSPTTNFCSLKPPKHIIKPVNTQHNYHSSLCLCQTVDALTDEHSKGLHVACRIYEDLLQCSIDQRALHLGLQLHAQVIKNGYYYTDGKKEYIETKLVILYTKCGSVEAANGVFHRMQKQNIFSWAAIIGMHSRNGSCEEALHCYVQMLESGFLPDNFVVPNALKACSVLGWVRFGRGVHGLAAKMMGFDGCAFVASSLVDMYGKCRVLEDAQKVFDSMLEKNVIAWNSMVAVYMQNGMNREAIGLFQKMMLDGVEPTLVSLVGFLSACANLEAVEEGRQGHALAILGGFELESILGSTVVNFYFKVGLVEEAELVFRRMVVKDVVTWNLIISSYVRCGEVEKAIEMCHMMTEENLRFDCKTLSSLLHIAADTRDVGLGMEAHGHCIKCSFDFDVVITSGIMDMYAKCGRIDYARRVFGVAREKDIVVWNTMLAAYAELGLSDEASNLFFQMQQENTLPNVVSWNSVIFSFFQSGEVVEAQNMLSEMYYSGVKPNMITWTTVISGFAKNGCGYEAFQAFRKMQEAGMKPNSISITSALLACKSMALLKYGKAIHGYVMRSGMFLSLHITTSIIDMYAKCGNLEYAVCVFTLCSRKQIAVYNAMISAYASHGQAMEALTLFKQLEKECMVPDHITITSVLSACSHAGLVNEALGVFKYMVSGLHMQPNEEHFGCLIKLLADDGQWDEAFRVILTMATYPDAHMLGSLLTACGQHQETELAARIAKWLMNLEPENAGNYVALSNVYAAEARWDKVSIVRRLMKEKGLRKIPGCSWIEVGQELHVFTAGDRSHPENDEIYILLNLLGLEIQSTKYDPYNTEATSST